MMPWFQKARHLLWDAEMENRRNINYAFSISGHLYIKQLKKVFTLLRPRRRFYFALNEITEELCYYRSELDFAHHKVPFESISISNAFITLHDTNNRVFIIHSKGKVVELEADNEKSCQCWLEALSRRYTKADQLDFGMLRKSKRSASLPDNESSIGNFQEVHPMRKYSTPLKPSYDNFTSTHPQRISDLALLNMNDWVSCWLQNEKFQNCSTEPSNPSTPTSSYHSKQSMNSEKADDETIQLREITNSQKKRIEDLKSEMNSLTMHLEQMRKRCDSSNSSSVETLSAQNKFLNSEVLRMSVRTEQLELQNTKLSSDNKRLDEELQKLKRDYVYAIQSTIRIPVHDNSCLDTMTVKLLGGSNHKSRLLQLVAEARNTDPSLPTLQGLMQGFYVDSFGFRIFFTDEPIALHYIATKLHQFYYNISPEAVAHRMNWKNVLESHNRIEVTKDMKLMCRLGIPNSLRAAAWRVLINRQVDDLKIIYGRHYYKSLCNTQGGEEERTFSEAHQKQINLDLLRTMPNNVHFMSANSKGVTQLQQVLRAFCLHNNKIGYCQGMNFLAATALLFVGPEDAFWLLIAVTERYFDKTYFDSNLTGAQADQEVLKGLLESQFPKLSHHLQSVDVDLASITLNWFIALFFDAIPFNTLLRIWDCFLLEGPKVLFRFALVLLGKHEEEIIGRNDAIGIMRVSKAAAKLTFDENAIVEAAFNIPNLPSRTELKALQTQYITMLAEQLEKRSIRAHAFVKNMSTSTSSTERTISNVFISGHEPPRGFVVSGHHMLGKIAKIVLQDGRGVIKDIDIEFDCRVMSMCIGKENIAYIGLVSGFILAARIDPEDSWSILWELKLPDVATCLLQREETLFALLANGTLTIFENAFKWPANVQMWHVPLSAAPISEAILYDDLLVVATACKLITLDAISLTTLSTIHVASSSVGSGVILFDKINCMSESPYGIFVCTDHSTLVQLWEDSTCHLLFDISFDHKTRKPSLSETEVAVYVEAVLFISSVLWIGTSDGYVILYSVENDDDNDGTVKFFSSQKPRGTLTRSQRLKSVAEDEDELFDVNPVALQKKRGSRVSINIDRDTGNYSVETVSPIQKTSDRSRLSSPSRFNSFNSQHKAGLQKGISADSAVSVFSSEAYIEVANKTSPYLQMPEESSTNSSLTSMEYDDTFELYSDEERSRKKISIRGSRRNNNDPDQELTLKRRDLQVDDSYIVPVPDHLDTSNDLDTNSVIPTIKLSLQMKLKVSDTSVRRIVACGNDHVLTCSGEIGADEAVLVWRRDQNRDSKIWINDPVITAESLENQRKRSSSSNYSR